MAKPMKWILAIYMMVSFSSHAIAQETIRLTTAEFAPFTSQSLKYNGVINRVISEAFALEGVKVEYSWFPWKRAYREANEGGWDGSSYWYKTPEREKDFLFSDVVTNSTYAFFHIKGSSFDWNTLEDLQGMPIGGTIGYFYKELFEPMEKEGKLDVQWVPKDEHNLKKLLKQRIKIFPSNIDVAFDLLQIHFTPQEIKKFSYHPKPLRQSPAYLILSKKVKGNQRMLELFNKGLKRLKDSGKYQQYFEESRRGEYKKVND
jgi:polar amino acid transport system substrate-binding protein